jgi:hypothetical protein
MQSGGRRSREAAFTFSPGRMKMAKQLEQFKKELEEIKKSLSSGEDEITKTTTDRIHLDKLIEEHTKEIGRRVREHRRKGKAGTTIADFKDENDVKPLLAGIDKHLAQMEQINMRVKTHASGDWAKLGQQYVSLKKELPAEIAARKKELSTKLGLGNKSAPEMEKLLPVVNDAGLSKRVAKLAKYSQLYKNLLDINTNKTRVADQLKYELAKSKDLALTQDQEELFESLLSDRNLKFASAEMRGLAKAVAQGVTEVITLKNERRTDVIKDKRKSVDQTLQRFLAIVTKYETAKKTLGEAKIMTNVKGPAIKQAITEMTTTRDKVMQFYAKLPT